jgi:hypothetical protein
VPDIVIAFFILGFVAGYLKSDLQVPKSIYETLSLLLMLVLGLKGGLALHGQALAPMLPSIGLVIAVGFIIPLLLYPLLRHIVRLCNDDAAAVAACYGSVSAGTFAVVLAAVDAAGLPLAPQTTLFLVLLELPAIVIMLMVHRHYSGSGKLGHILQEALTSRGVLLLGGGVLIGALYGPDGLAPLSGALFGGFKTMLALFLLEMGLCTAKVCRPMPWHAWRLFVFALTVPLALSWVGIGMGLWLDLPEGTVWVLATLMASASYIAAPAAIRAAIPDANLGLTMLASLGITFPLNVLIGIPLYKYWTGLFF